MEDDAEVPSSSRGHPQGLPPDKSTIRFVPRLGARSQGFKRGHWEQKNNQPSKTSSDDWQSFHAMRNTGRRPDVWRNKEEQDPGVANNSNTSSQERQHNRSGFKYNSRSEHRHPPKQSPFRILETLAACDDKDILGKISEKRQFFVNLFKSPVNKPDIFVLVFNILAKMCRSAYDDLKIKLLISVCNESFVMQLRNYLTDLPDDITKSKNILYWNNENKFWHNFITFCENIMNLSPSMALKMYRPLICKVSTSCLHDLNSRHGFKLQDDNMKKLEELQNKLTQYENKGELEKKEKRFTAADEGQPPESFRELPIIPDHNYLMRRPFLRPNIVDGAYHDVEHYLDIQFRLLQEDCYGPLREGIYKCLEDPGRGKFDNIRVYKNIKFLGPYVSESKVGVIVKLDRVSNRRFFKINWNTSKRLLYGSLVIISKDNFKRFIVATVLDRDEKMLCRGLLPICIINNDYNGELSGDETYTLIESEVYFEPYHHVLKVLQHRSFPDHLAMKNYIVKAEALTNPPAYLSETKEYVILHKDKFRNITNPLMFTVLDSASWPTAAQLGLNESQYEAYRLALTHEFTVIQGPPGTGKTFIGTKIAQTLIENLDLTILVVCYTNHALDQFLENISSFTESIARVGSRSKNKAMEKLSLQNWRSKIKHLPSYILYRDEKDSFKRIVIAMKRLQEHINSLDDGLLSYSSIARYVQESRILERYYGNSRDDIITDWLFENMPIVLIPNEEAEILNALFSDVTPQRARIYLEEEFDDVLIEDALDDDDNFIQVTFSLENARNRWRHLMKENQLDEKLQRELAVLNSKIHLFNEMKKQIGADRHGVRTLTGKNPKYMSNEDRWSTYVSWTKIILNQLQQRFNRLYVNYETECKSFEEARMNWDREVLQHVRVIGMTTTGAARMRKTIQELNPAIVIVEEAAEVLEQHVVTSLTSNCQHLILIGDHQQLRPSAAYMKLAKHYNIEISLFERMIRNKVANKRLNVQHRMRPEIASLIVPHIYQDLVNHPHVENKPNVRGVLHNVFFLSHNFMEQKADEGSSRTNRDEADVALGLANYLIQQDYAPEDITILAAYSGQMFYMRQQRNSYIHLKNVKITVVDNYQGEESKIIILSLVRNNLENKIGFLSTENRVCVALSRAKEGFFMLGNIDILRRNSELWEKVSNTLENMDSLGTSLKLKCEKHPTQIATIEKVEDFEKTPEGGCLLKCGYILDCKHVCPQLCHSYDRAHSNIPCVEKCERVLCELNHVCPKMCNNECGPCMVPMEKKLPCRHDKYLPCHQKPDGSVQCTVLIKVTLPRCGHEIRKACSQDIESVKCIVKCVYRVQQCGHACTRDCHVTDDPDHKKYVCVKPCPKAKKGCTAKDLLGDRRQHQCPNMCFEPCQDCNVEIKKKRSTCKHWELVACHEDVDEKPCLKKCARSLSCGHHCPKKCHEPCGDCITKVKKEIPECNHEVKIECGKTATRADCGAACERLLSCGHACQAACREPCERASCTALSTTTYLSHCGHRVALPCNIVLDWSTIEKSEQEKILLKQCSAPCNQTLKCGHVCSGTCSQCLQGRIHMPCRQTCQKINICGHACEEPCNQVCPPCNKPCEVSCVHSKCNKPCGSPCSPCQEKCSRVCPHGACANRCGEPCSRSACNESCARVLSCGHACRGLCGEPCPDICNICKPETFPKDFLGYEFEADARFIQLQDCPHVLEVDDLDCLMSGDSSTIAIRACPFCRKCIINTQRYKDLVNNQFYTDINRIKRKIFGNDEEIINKKIQFKEAAKKLPEVVLKENKHFLNASKVGCQLKRNASLLDLEMKVTYFSILDIIGDYYSIYLKEKLQVFKAEILKQMKLLCQSLIRNKNKVSEQLQSDIKDELKRLSSIIQLSQVVSHETYGVCKEESLVKQALANATDIILSWHAFDSQAAASAIKNLQEKLKQSKLVVTQMERSMIVKAMGMSLGHWFKCPNGHIYCIGDCGGAMEVGKCYECGESVGGTSHRLLSSNSHAREMDGSLHPAWSEQNNLANYRINF